VSAYHFRCVLPSDLKEKYATALGHNVFTTALRSTYVLCKQKQGRKCDKCSSTDRRLLRRTHSAQVKHTVLCIARLCKNFAFTFQLMTVGLLNTAGIQKLKYQDHGIFRTSSHPTVLQISVFSVKLPDINTVR